MLDNPEAPLGSLAKNKFLRSVRFCKAIEPADENARKECVKYKGNCGNSGQFAPRIVKDKFKIPANWREVISYREGQPFNNEHNHRITTLSLSGETLMLVHTCRKPYDTCHEGFWGLWIRSDVADPELEAVYARQNRDLLTRTRKTRRVAAGPLVPRQ